MMDFRTRNALEFVKLVINDEDITDRIMSSILSESKYAFRLNNKQLEVLLDVMNVPDSVRREVMIGGARE